MTRAAKIALLVAGLAAGYFLVMRRASAATNGSGARLDAAGGAPLLGFQASEVDQGSAQPSELAKLDFGFLAAIKANIDKLGNPFGSGGITAAPGASPASSSAPASSGGTSSGGSYGGGSSWKTGGSYQIP